VSGTARGFGSPARTQILALAAMPGHLKKIELTDLKSQRILGRQMTKLKVIIMATFLSSLFSCGNKKSENSEQSKSVNTPVGSTWDNINNSEHSVVQFEVDGKLCFATINQYFKNYKNKGDFPFSLWVKVETRDKNNEGHPVDEEAVLFNSLEDSLIETFISKTAFCYIGRTTRDGYRELMFYVTDKGKATEIMNEFVKKDTFKRRIEFTVDPDATWESVSGLY
jgi:hypothetical protein